MLDNVEQRDGWWWPKNDHNGWVTAQEYPDFPKKLSELCRKKNIVVQAGGCCGLYAKQFADIFQTVYTFEPDSTNFACLTLNCNQHNVIKLQACVGSQHNQVSLNTYNQDTCALHVSKSSGHIPTLKIDDLNLSDCNLIQLDTEGFEFFALLGAENTIQKYQPIISVEWYEDWASRYNISLKTLEGFLLAYGYNYTWTYGTDRIYIPS